MLQNQILNSVFRARNSVVFTPAASQEDITVLSSEESDLDTSESGSGEKEKAGEEEDVRILTCILIIFSLTNVCLYITAHRDLS